MNKFVSGILAAGLMLGGASAFADDTAPSTTTSTMPRSSTSKHQMMKDCMARQAAKNDGSTKTQMKNACRDEMKSGVSTDSSMSTTTK